MEFISDKEIKIIALDYFKRKALEKGFEFVPDEEYMNNNHSRADLKFDLVKNNKHITYYVEIKNRTGSTIDTYKDVMFEEEKLEYLKEQINNGKQALFLSVYKDYSALLYDVSKIDKWQIGVSHQHKYTEIQCKEKINIVKAYLPTTGAFVKTIHLK